LPIDVVSCEGNIRVYVRVRPPLPTEVATDIPTAAITFPDKRDHREIVLTSTTATATGTERTDTALFSFDRVFEPRASQSEVFEDVGQLVQSVTDGYNCTIFSYGQTGSGKTWTMEGGKTLETTGMIPRAVKQVFDTAESAKAQGWDYTMKGQFLEIVGSSLPPFLRLVDYCRGGGSTMKRSTIYSGRANWTNASTRLNTIRVDGPLSQT
jgi:kinesin family protein C1